MPTMKNPPFVGRAPGLGPALDLHRRPDRRASGGRPSRTSPGYPTKFYASLSAAPGNANVHPPSQFIPMAKAGTLPQVCYVWSPAGLRRAPARSSATPSYVTKGQDLVWQRVQAVIDGGGWDDTTFILTWDDWGGYADSVPTPAIETVPDALHPDGYAAIGGSRIPLVMFGGKVGQGIDPQWHSHASASPRRSSTCSACRPWGSPASTPPRRWHTWSTLPSAGPSRRHPER